MTSPSLDILQQRLGHRFGEGVLLNQALTHGEVRRGWLGASFAPVQRLGLEQGALVSNVIADSPAAKPYSLWGYLAFALLVASFIESLFSSRYLAAEQETGTAVRRKAA